ncbi:hypothetical protein EFS18_09625 [Levilactobacillus brevis]|nr:hypothetical protein [Levilactobacillus brevis]
MIKAEIAIVSAFIMQMMAGIDANINAAPSWYAYKADHATKGLTMTELPSSEVAPAKVSGLLNKKSTNGNKLYVEFVAIS